MSDSKKTNRYFLEENKNKGKKNIKDVNRERKFDWRDKLEDEEENLGFEDLNETIEEGQKQ